MTSPTPIPRARLGARIALFVRASPIVVLMGKSLVEDPRPVWIGGYLYQSGVRQEISVWDVVEDVVLLTTTLLQLVPARRDRAG